MSHYHFYLLKKAILEVVNTYEKILIFQTTVMEIEEIKRKNNSFVGNPCDQRSCSFINIK